MNSNHKALQTLQPNSVLVTCLDCLLPRVRGSAARVCDQTVQLGPAEAGLSADRFAAIDRKRFAPAEQKLLQSRIHASQVRHTVGCARRQNDLKCCDASVFVFVP